MSKSWGESEGEKKKVEGVVLKIFKCILGYNIILFIHYNTITVRIDNNDWPRY